MSNRRLVSSVFWNCAGLAVGTVAGFIIAPFLIHRLGETTYGLWMVIGALTSYFGLLELGVRRSVGRQVAFHRARADCDSVNETVATALAILGGLGTLAMVGVFASLLIFFDIFDVPPEQVNSARLALILVGINLALTLIFDVFDAALWGLQRFDFLNGVEIPTTLARAGLTFYFIGAGGGLVSLAVITLCLTVVNGLAKLVLCFVEERGLRVGPGLIRGKALREIFGYSVWNFIGGMTTLTRMNLSPLMVGALIGVAPTTAYSIVSRLTNTVASILIAATDTLIPWATGLHANQLHEGKRGLFLYGGRYCAALSFYFLGLLVLLGGPLIGLWIGPNLLYALPLLWVLVIGETLANTQFVTSSMIFAEAKHRTIAMLAVVEVVAVVVLMFVLVEPLSLLGVGLALAVPGSLCRGLAFLWKGCSLLRIPPAQYVWHALLVPGLCAAGPFLALWAWASWHEPDTWPELVFYSACYSCLFVFTCALGMEYALVKRLLHWTATRVWHSSRKPAANLAAGPQEPEAPRSACAVKS